MEIKKKVSYCFIAFLSKTRFSTIAVVYLLDICYIYRQCVPG